MKLEVYELEKADNVVRLRLCPNYETGGVTLRVVDKDGKRKSCGNLLTFRPSGKVIFEPSVSTEFGFLLDQKGRLIIKD